MGNVTELTIFICPRCGDGFEDYDDAVACCPVKIRAKKMWRCASCEKLWYTKEEAKACCEDDEEDIS